MNRFFRNAGFYLLIFLITVGIVSLITGEKQEKSEITYNEFIQKVQANQISELYVTSEGLTLKLTGKTTDNKEFISRALFSEEFSKQLNQELVKSKVKINEPQRDSVWLTFLTSIVPFIVMFILFFFLMNQAQGGGSKVMNFGKSKAKLYNEEKKKVTFDDVAGADEEKNELVEVVEFLKDPRKFSALGARIPKGVLLNGPPGTGKTLLARAVAGEAGVPFFSISGSDFVEMFVGVGASRVRDLFETAKKNAPCIIFIDEIDAVGRHRGAGLGGGHDEREQTLNQLLVEMDGFGANEGIIIIAATNRPDILDPALLRPGRFDRQITVNRPDVKGREEILKVHARNKPISPDVSLEAIAKRTVGFTGADLENVLNEAALLAARQNKKVIEEKDIDEAIDRVIAGPEKKSRVISERERRLVAYHEAGHAVVGYHLPHADEVHKITIVPRGLAGGYTVMIPKEDRYFMTKSELFDRISGLLGGRVAEEIAFNEISTGAHNDLQRVTEIARRMVTEYGMSEKLGNLQYGHRHGGQVFLGRDLGTEQNYSDAIALEIDKEMRSIIDQAYETTRRVLTEHLDQLDLLANVLLERETIDKAIIDSLMETGKMPDGTVPEIKVRAGQMDDDKSSAANRSDDATKADSEKKADDQ
jgi:cell division protease FtsH